MSKRTAAPALGLLALLLAAGCQALPAAKAAPSPAPAAPFGAERILPYVHIDGFGTETEEAAWIAWEFEAQDFVKYQVVFTSCTCRPESINERSLLYLEIAKAESGGKIRKVKYEYWGDSQRFPSGLGREEVERDYVPLLANKRLEQIEKLDTISGATVTTVNLRQISAAVLTYHNAAYPAKGVPEPADYVDATSAATE